MTGKAKLGRMRMARRESSGRQRHHDRPETPNEITSNMTIPCPHCGSLSFYNERFSYCHKRKMNLETYPFPHQLEKPFTEDSERGRNARQNIRRYTDFSCLTKAHVYFTPLFIMQMIHIPPPSPPPPPRFNQCYICQRSEACRLLNAVTGGCCDN